MEELHLRRGAAYTYREPFSKDPEAGDELGEEVIVVFVGNVAGGRVTENAVHQLLLLKRLLTVGGLPRKTV